MTGVDAAAIRARHFPKPGRWLHTGVGSAESVEIREGDVCAASEHRIAPWPCDAVQFADELAVAEQQRDDALAKIARVEALCAAFDPASGSGRVRAFVGDLRALLSATPTAETVPPRVAGTGGPQNPAQGCGHIYPDGAPCTPDGHADLADRAAAHDRPGVE